MQNSLKDFVKETLIEISGAVKEFSDDQKKYSATARPVAENGVEKETWAKNGLLVMGFFHSDTVGYATVIDFDVAITVEDAVGTKAGGGIRVLSAFKVEGGVETQANSSSVSRVRFRLPLQVV